jgi:hypothetical protein
MFSYKEGGGKREEGEKAALVAGCWCWWLGAAE